MASAKQLAANRRNAQHSSGPKSEQGKRRSAINALRHGLTVPVELSALAVHLPQLKAWLQADLTKPFSPRELALRILDYERNVQHLQSAFEVEEQTSSPTPQAAEDLQSAARVREWAEDVALGFSRAERGHLRQLGKIIERAGKHKMQEAERQLQRAGRHYRRAANQLLKGLRNLDS